MLKDKDAGRPAGKDFEDLLGLMDTLRSDGGCPWVQAQTHSSLKRYLPEETYEVLEALEDPAGPNLPLLREELGDLLLNIIFHARLASETPRQEGGFTMQDVVATLAQKLIRRNPHVFGPEGADGLSAREVYEAWDLLKKAEKPERIDPFDGIPPGLPALATAAKVLDKARTEGLDLEAPAGRLQSQSGELELGARLFELVKEAGESGVDPESALRSYTRSLLEAYRVQADGDQG